MMFLIFLFVVITISIACGVFIGSIFVCKQLEDIKSILEDNK